MRGIFEDATGPYWLFTSIIMFFLFWVGIANDDPLWLQTIPVTMAVLGALTLDRSWRGVAVVLGITLLMYITYCLRHFGPY